MREDFPKDPAMLLSVVNTKLRDFYFSLEDFCQAEAVDGLELMERLATIDYHYNREKNQFE